MKSLFIALIGMLLVQNIAQAAPYYVGTGCNEEGTRCTFGKPSGRVLQWSKKGTVSELGERCENFINTIEARKNEIAKNREDVKLSYKKFTYSWSADVQSDGRAKIVCNVELHSEVANVKFETKKFKEFFWVCEDENSPGICRHFLRECEAEQAKALENPEVLDATIYRGASLVQGSICTVATIKFKKK